MSRIDTENAKAIRKAMNVLCGMEMYSELTPVVSATDSYDNIDGDVFDVPVFVQYMDLSGNGFPNDGSAVPLEADHAGIIAQVDEDGSSTLNMSVGFEGNITDALKATQDAYVYYYEGEQLKQYKIDYGTPVSWDPRPAVDVQIRSAYGRIQVVRVAAGTGWWFDRNSLVSCSVALRGVETKTDKPELQVSEIEIIGYEPDNVLDKAAVIGDDAPVYYSCGYPGDMSPIRKFYLSDKINWSENKITIKAEDATKHLEATYEGRYIGDSTGYSGGLNRYIGGLHDMLTAAGVEHEYINEYEGDDTYSDGYAILFKQEAPRSIIATAVNVFKEYVDRYSEVFSNPIINYVDAGRPVLHAGRRAKEISAHIEYYAGLTVDTDRKLKEAKLTRESYDASTIADVETVKVRGSVLKALSEPYRLLTTSLGTITRLNPYKYRLNGTGSALVRGYKIETSNTETETASQNAGVETVDLGTIPNLYTPQTRGLTFQALQRGLKLYTFTWRGDPRLQPRDYITVDIDGEPVEMTIESITLDHSDGGLTSQIVAREGLI